MTDKIDLDKLEVVANKATPGPWAWEHDEMERGNDYLHMTAVRTTKGVLLDMRDGCDIENAEFIASCYPQSIKRFIAIVRAADKMATVAIGYADAECYGGNNHDDLASEVAAYRSIRGDAT